MILLATARGYARNGKEEEVAEEEVVACDARGAAWRAILVTNAPPRVGAAARL